MRPAVPHNSPEPEEARAAVAENNVPLVVNLIDFSSDDEESDRPTV